MADLFASRREGALKAIEPLAVRMRPRTLDEFIGQSHIVGDRGESTKPLLRRMIESGTLSSIILHGPPGTGKTTLAEVIAGSTGRHFVRENAAGVGVARVREIIADAKRRIEDGATRTVLFLDEIHRFSKSQQDVLLADVERGVITLIGATTENPMFSVNSALVSRSVVFRLERLTDEDTARVLRAAIADRERGYGTLDIRATDEAIEHWASMSEGDARRALTALEVAIESAETNDGCAIEIGLQEAAESIQRKAIVYDRDGRGVLLTDRVPAQRRCDVLPYSKSKTSPAAWAPIPACDYYFALAERLLNQCGVRPSAMGPMELVVTENDEMIASGVLQKAGVPSNTKYVVLNPGGNDSAKRWPADRYAALASYLCEHHDLRVLVNGAPSERELVGSIIGKCKDDAHVHNLADSGVTLGALKAIVRDAQLMVTNDTGPRHIAAAVGTPVVSLFGPTDARWTTIPFKDEIVMSADPELPEEEVANDHPERCKIDRIKLGDVVASVNSLLNSAPIR